MSMKETVSKWGEKVLPAINKFGSNKYLLGLKDGISAIIPFTIIGSVFLIITNFPIQAWQDFIAPAIPYLNIPYNACMGMLAIVSVAAITFNLAKEFGVNKLSSSFIALIAFIVTQTDLEGGISTANFGAGGLFLAIVVAIVTVKVVEFCEKRNIIIKLPDSVPPMVGDAFSSIIPGFAVIVFAWIISGVLGVDVNAVLTSVFQPLVGGLNTLPGTLLVILLSTGLWCCGINESVISGATYPVWYALLAENTAKFEAGLAATNFGAYGFQYFGFWLGGTGGTIGLVILMLMSKSKTYRDLGKLSTPSTLFEINEPVAFGFPICFNPVMCVPYILFPMISTTLYYFAVVTGLVGAPVASIPWTTPPVLSGFLVTGGDWRAAVFQILMIALAVVVYYPFFKYSEKNMVAQETEEKD